MILKYLNQIIILDNVNRIALDDDQIAFLKGSDDDLIAVIDIDKWDDNLWSIRQKHSDNFDYKDMRSIKWAIARKVYEKIWKLLISDAKFYDINNDMDSFVEDSVKEFEEEFPLEDSENEEKE